jgi:hypothetical protein
MIRVLLASWFLAAGSAAAPGEIAATPALNIDPCVAVDDALVRQLIALELHDGHSRNLRLPDSVAVRCLDELQEIRMEPWASTAPEGIRTIQLPPAGDMADAPTRQARSRELALAIAESLRRFEMAHPPVAKPEEGPLPAPPLPLPPPVVAEHGTPLQRAWEIGVLSKVDHFANGQNLAGGDLFANLRLGSWFLAEVHGGGRWGADVTLPQGRLTTRAVAMGAALGVHHLTRWLDAALVVQSQWYLIRFRAEQPSDERTQDAWLGVCSLAVEPRLTIGLTRHLRLELSAAVGVPVRGILVRVRGAEMKSPSGVVVSGALGAGVTF